VEAGRVQAERGTTVDAKTAAEAIRMAKRMVDAMSERTKRRIRATI
jgi:hypothetical protein